MQVGEYQSHSLKLKILISCLLDIQIRQQWRGNLRIETVQLKRGVSGGVDLSGESARFGRQIAKQAKVSVITKSQSVNFDTLLARFERFHHSRRYLSTAESAAVVLTVSQQNQNARQNFLRFGVFQPFDSFLDCLINVRT